jgi:sugar lactone lactonase YvrE
MAKRYGVGDYQYESVDNWAEDIPGVASDAACDSQGRVYVAVRLSQAFDNNHGAIVVYDKDGKRLTSWGEDYLKVPHSIWISPDDEILFTDTWDHVVRKYSTSGELLMTLGMPGMAGMPGGPFNMPTGVVQSETGDIFVSDGYRQSRVHRFTADGELVLSWGSGDRNNYEENIHASTPTPGTGPGEFNLPHSVTVGSDGRVYIMDRSNLRIQVFDSEGNYLDEWNDVPSPNQATIDDDGIMHVATAAGVQVRTLEGELLGTWGEKGDRPDQFSGAPHGIWIDSTGDVYVAQVGAQKALNKFARL